MKLSMSPCPQCKKDTLHQSITCVECGHVIVMRTPFRNVVRDIVAKRMAARQHAGKEVGFLAQRSVANAIHKEASTAEAARKAQSGLTHSGSVRKRPSRAR